MPEHENGNFEKAGRAIGGLAGRTGDAAVHVVESLIRTAAGTVGGWWSDRTPDEAVSRFGEREDRSCRTHFENVARRGTNYDAVRPLYQFGHLAGANPDYQGRSFEEVESELKTTWSDEQARTFGDWESVRDYINTGYSTGR
jgi:hypothetical protein